MNGLSHQIVIQQAKKILENDHRLTFAYVANFYESELLRGTSYADNAGVPVYIYERLNWLFFEIKTWRQELFNSSSLSHYYDPGTDQGLNLAPYRDVEGLAEAGGVLAAILLGFAGFNVDVWASPPFKFNAPYQSSADLCQEQYDLAVEIWGRQHPVAGDKWAEAMFHLGWACHLIADICVSPHTVSNEWMSHNSYEDFIDQLVADEPNIHAQFIGANLAQYGLNASARELIVQAAIETQRELYLYQEDRWDEGARQAIPRAEIYTARLLAKFFNEVGVAALPKTLKATVKEFGAFGIPKAVIFYRKGIQEWQPLITDQQGSVNIPLAAGDNVKFRPAVPGYLFEGHYIADAPEAGIPEFHANSSPVSYMQPANPIQVPLLTFQMRSLVPQVVMGRIPVQQPLARNLGPVQRAMRRQPTQAEMVEAMVDATIADLVDVEVSGAAPGIEAKLKVGSAEQVKLRVHVYRPVLLNTGHFVRSLAEINELSRSAVEMQPAQRAIIARQRRDDMARGAPRQLVQPEPEVLEALRNTATIVDAAGIEVYDGARIKNATGLQANMPLILAAAPHIHRVTVEVVQGPGTVGYCCPGPVTLDVNTNPSGEAWIYVLPGNQAGRLRLKITVCEADAGPDNIGEIMKTVELWVLPPDADGFDTEPLVAPRLQLEALQRIRRGI